MDWKWTDHKLLWTKQTFNQRVSGSIPDGLTNDFNNIGERRQVERLVRTVSRLISRLREKERCLGMPKVRSVACLPLPAKFQ